MNLIRRAVTVTALALALTVTPAAPAQAKGHSDPHVSVLATGLGAGAGSTIGPDGALYVTRPLTGAISRIDRRTGKVTTYADGLPPMNPAVGIGGAMDLIFRHRTAYVLVSLVGPDVGGKDVVGIYRVNGRHSVSVVADIGAFNLANPPETDFFVPTGLQYAMENVPGGFLVTDGHLNRVLRVSLKGKVSELVTFADVVPTGLEVKGKRVWMAQAGPLPHLPESGKVFTFGLRHPEPRQVASGGRLLVDVEWGHGKLYALAQGVWPLGGEPGSPASPDTGQLLRRHGGGFDVVASGLDRPTSMEIVGKTAYVVTLDGEVWTVNLSRRHHGHHGRG